MANDSILAPGCRVVVRDEEWLVRSSVPVATGGYAVRVVGTSELVRNQERSFLTELEEKLGSAIVEMRPEDTRLVADDSPKYRRSRLYLENIRWRIAQAKADICFDSRFIASLLVWARTISPTAALAHRLARHS
jgi:predicted flavoprotein YhiN